MHGCAAAGGPATGDVGTSALTQFALPCGVRSRLSLYKYEDVARQYALSRVRDDACSMPGSNASHSEAAELLCCIRAARHEPSRRTPRRYRVARRDRRQCGSP